MSGKAKAVVRIRFLLEDKAKILFESLRPEAVSSINIRSRVRLSRECEELKMFFHAKDTAALRASLNSYLRWLYLLNNVYEIIKSMV